MASLYSQAGQQLGKDGDAVTTPSVTIKIKGVTDTSEPSSDDLYMMYVQATNGEERRQWVMIPPANSHFDGIDPEKSGKHLYITRLQEFEGNRSKWHRFVSVSGGDLQAQIEDRRKNGWKITGPILVKLDLDDYVTFWRGGTSHKALRAVDRALAPFKITVK